MEQAQTPRSQDEATSNAKPALPEHSRTVPVVAKVAMLTFGVTAAVFAVGGGLNLFRTISHTSGIPCDDECMSAPVISSNMKILTDLKQQARVEYRQERAALGLPKMVDSSIVSGAVTTCADGFAGEYPCSKIDLHSVLSFADLGCPVGLSCEGSDIWGWVDSATDHEYALITTTKGISIVDVTDSLAPQPVVFMETPASDWHDVKVYNNHMYSVTEGKTGAYVGMQVFDLTRVRGRTTLANMTSDLVYTNNNLQNTHNIVINEDSGFAYLVGTNLCSGGLYILNLSTPLAPEFVGCFSSDRYTHDAQCVMYDGPHTAYVGREICFAYNEDTLTIVDVTDKANMVIISRTGYAGSSYTHQGWLTPDMKFVFLDDEYDELKAPAGSKATKTFVVDCTDLVSPVFVSTFTSAVDAIDHNQYITNDWYSFQTNYMAGLRVLDVQDVDNVFETAFFDVDPAENQAQFHGSWSSYPYFPSGNIIVSSIERGLFVVRPTSLRRGTVAPTKMPTKIPTSTPTAEPTSKPTSAPTSPTKSPTSTPTLSPTKTPTSEPTAVPTDSSSSPSLSGPAVIAVAVAGAVVASLSVGGAVLCVRNKKKSSDFADVMTSEGRNQKSFVVGGPPSYLNL